MLLTVPMVHPTRYGLGMVVGDGAEVMVEVVGSADAGICLIGTAGGKNRNEICLRR